MEVLSSVDPTSSGGATADPFRPSFFELIAQDQLSALLKPAVRYVLTVLAQRNPRHLLRFVNRFDEVYALLMLAIEWHYLRTWNASFTENFYGLHRRRRPLVSAKRVEAALSRPVLQTKHRLRSRDIRVSLLFLVGLPYVQTKLMEYWEHLGGGLLADADDDTLFGDEAPRRALAVSPADQSMQLRWLRRWKDAFRRGFPLAQVLLQLWMLAYNVAYLFNHTPYWRPWFRVMRIEVRRMRGDEQPLGDVAASKPLPRATKFPLLFAATVLWRGASGVFEMLKYALPASIFVFKFLEWWYSSNNPRRRSDGRGDEDAPKIAPPAVLPPSAKGVAYHRPDSWRDAHILAATPATENTPFADEDAAAAPPALLHNACPLCGIAPIQNACVLSTGYAFCYKCAHAYVDKWHRCPVTLQPLPGGTEEIRKVLV
ncbi:ubiquitin-protein ligase peroxin 12 [Malassezia sp. CBS 17886]|nr:ubiquitin-protein ligase peroxin 12 [Malassezia sp. CBS 17886]